MLARRPAETGDTMAIHRLSDRAVRTSKVGLKGDGGGLWLRTQLGKDGTPRRGWLFRYARGGKTHWMGLGSLDDVSLAEAREARTACRKMLREGTDPLANKKARRSEAAIAGAKSMTFKQCAEAYVRDHAAAWRSTRNDWIESLERHVY